MIPQLAPDIHEMIIDNLHDDKRTLSSCTLVSPSWTYSSRRYLFETIKVSGVVDEFEPFVKYLQESPHISTLIRHLRLLGNSSRRTFLCLHVLVDILSNLPRLRRLDLEEIWSTSSSCTCRSSKSISNSCFSVKQLSINTVIFTTLENVISFFSLYSVVEHLHVNSVSMRDWGDADPDYLNTLAQGFSGDFGVQSLQLRASFGDATFMQFFCDILRYAPSRHTLHSIRAEFLDWDDVATLGRLLQAIGPTIRHLAFDGLNELEKFDLPMQWHDLNLSSCSHLQSVFLVVVVSDIYDDLHDPFNYPLAMIRMMPRTVQNITFQLLSTVVHVKKNCENMDNYDWPIIAQLAFCRPWLSQPPCCHRGEATRVMHPGPSTFLSFAGPA
ncbi:hypothetical protein SCP_0803430 [Sparassis crispa]|uniref:F-box domain-containing protein n=1 Tax=Sparassis crispa TaxID=139825 RepID=A0A401GUC0_9APHY|nr:hypothetical protein SCP_0803430 [Sparassis crispa]GBE85821.1 hypothetical protein SCP_0803430 [Sparassis crispa]